MAEFWWIAVIALPLIVWIFRNPQVPADNSLAPSGAFGDLVQLLFRRGATRAQLTICHRVDRVHRVIFEKTVSGRDDYSLESTIPLPDAERSERIRSALARERINFGERRSGANDHSIVVHVGRDVGLALQVVRVVMQDVFGFNLGRDCVGYFNKRVLVVDAPHLTGYVERGT